MNVLVVYFKEKPVSAEKMFEGAEITWHDLSDPQAQKPPEKFNVVYCDCLDCVEARTVPGWIMELAGMLELKGELWLLTQSYEFAAQQAYMDKPHPAMHYVLYGRPDAPHRSCFTLAWLRDLVEGAGLILRQATQERQKIRNRDKDEEIPLNLVVGWKYEIADPAEAIQ